MGNCVCTKNARNYVESVHTAGDFETHGALASNMTYRESTCRRDWQLSRRVRPKLMNSKKQALRYNGAYESFDENRMQKWNEDGEENSFVEDDEPLPEENVEFKNVETMAKNMVLSDIQNESNLFKQDTTAIHDNTQLSIFQNQADLSMIRPQNESKLTTIGNESKDPKKKLFNLND